MQAIFDSLYSMVGVLNNYLWSYVLIIMLVVLGIYFTFRTKFVQFRYFKEMFKLLTDGNANKNAKKEGKISSFQAFCISTSSRVGTGNIAGIALAIAGGGPGAIFWMWIMALIGSASSFVESTLAQIYKVKNGTAYKGGPAYYIEQGLNMRWLGIIFTILISITYGFVFNSVQSNTFKEMFKLLTDGNANKNDKKEGKISSFQAFCISTSSRVGTGNIAGIALAIAGGGPGAIFLVWLMALIGYASSIV